MKRTERRWGGKGEQLEGHACDKTKNQTENRPADELEKQSPPARACIHKAEEGEEEEGGREKDIDLAE